MKSKYLIIKQESLEIPVVFPICLLHSEMARGKRVVSAGFCQLNTAGKWVVGGQSESLKLAARADDAEILNAHL